MARTQPAVTVRCDTCGSRFDLSVRNELEHRKRGKPHVCHDCRTHRMPEPTARDYAYWLDRFALAELRSWPPLEP